MPYKDRDKRNEHAREYNKGWYQRNKEKKLALNIERKIRMREMFEEIKSSLRCADCGERHPATLHFHHRNPAEKEFNIADWVGSGGSIEKLEKEIAKCIVLCANCHAKRHYEANTKGKYEDLGAEGQLQALVAASRFTPEEEQLYTTMFGNSGDTEQEWRDYQSYWGVDPRRRE